jgi:hypothetical protein
MSGPPPVSPRTRSAPDRCRPRPGCSRNGGVCHCPCIGTVPHGGTPTTCRSARGPRQALLRLRLRSDAPSPNPQSSDSLVVRFSGRSRYENPHTPAGSSPRVVDVVRPSDSDVGQSGRRRTRSCGVGSTGTPSFRLTNRGLCRIADDPSPTRIFNYSTDYVFFCINWTYLDSDNRTRGRVVCIDGRLTGCAAENSTRNEGVRST